jgi:hypothetical protein
MSDGMVVAATSQEGQVNAPFSPLATVPAHDKHLGTAVLARTCLYLGVVRGVYHEHGFFASAANGLFSHGWRFAHGGHWAESHDTRPSLLYRCLYLR